MAPPRRGPGVNFDFEICDHSSLPRPPSGRKAVTLVVPMQMSDQDAEQLQKTLFDRFELDGNDISGVHWHWREQYAGDGCKDALLPDLSRLHHGDESAGVPGTVMLHISAADWSEAEIEITGARPLTLTKSRGDKHAMATKAVGKGKGKGQRQGQRQGQRHSQRHIQSSTAPHHSDDEATTAVAQDNAPEAPATAVAAPPPDPTVTVSITYERGTFSDQTRLQKRSSTCTEVAAWPQDVLSYPPDTTIASLLGNIADRLFGRVIIWKQRTAKGRRAIRQRTVEVPWSAWIPAPDTPTTLVCLTDGKFRVAQLGDLFVNRLTTHSLAVHVLFAVRKVQRLEEHVQPTWQLLDQEYDIIRVGIAADDPARHKISTSTTGGALESPIHSDWPLLAWRNVEDEDQMPTQLFSVHAYDFGAYCIGDARSNVLYHEEAFSVRHRYLQPFDHIKSRRALDTAIATYIKQEPRRDVGSGVPLLPSYCFNELDRDNAVPRGVGLDDSMVRVDDTVDIAVRCVSHLKAHDDNGGAEADLIWFPHDLRFAIGATSNARDVWKLVKVRLKTSRMRGNGGPRRESRLRPSSLLYEKPLHGTWSAQFWICPQVVGTKDEERKMYRFTRNKRSESQVPLSRFLIPDLWAKKDRRLCLEAHIIPIAPEDWVVTGTMGDGPDGELVESAVEAE